MSHQKNISLSEKSYYKTGGMCNDFFLPNNTEQLKEYLKYIKQNNLNLFILGAGSNSLISDLPWTGAVICLEELNKIRREGSNIICGAGVSNSELAKFALQEGLEGCSWLYGLPGFLGGTARMNARCYGGEISQVADEIICFSMNGEKQHHKDEVAQQKCFKGYKDTIFMNNKIIIAELVLKLKNGNKENIQNKMNACFEDRKSKGQFDLPSCGCVFKNNYTVGVPSGMLIDLCGLRGKSLGGAAIHDKHCNFIVNQDKASSKDILELSFYIREKVWEEFGVWLEYEMEVLGALTPSLQEKLDEKRNHVFKKTKIEDAREKFLQKKSKT